jgi:hypothetical protein
MNNKNIFLKPLLICRKSTLASIRRAAHNLERGSGAIAVTDAIEATLARILWPVVFGDRTMISSKEWVLIK